MNIEKYCTKCVKRQTCIEPCRPIEKYLREGKCFNAEIHTEREIICFPSSGRELRFSEIPGYRFEEVEACTESPFTTFNPKYKQTGIFIDRFFHGMSVDECALKYEITNNDVSCIYKNAKARLLQGLKVLDDKYLAMKSVQRKGRKFSVDEKLFILNKLFDIGERELEKLSWTPCRETIRKKVNQMAEKYCN